MQQKYVTRDRYVLILALFIFTIGTYSLFANTNSENLLEVTTIQNQVKGVVTDSNGIPIPGVTIQIKGTSKGTFTNDKGEFIINASPTDILVLTYIGFKTLEVSVGNSSEPSLVLHEDVTNLDAVTVNAGYYTVKERERTGSISKVTAEEIELQPIVSPIQSLEGRVTGIEVEQGSGITGLAPTIRIRGRNSLRNTLRDNGNYPLFVINGIPISSEPLKIAGGFTNIAGIDPLSTLSLSNIESIEVLKDADATAIYGSRGANGVILITTKKSELSPGETSLNLNVYSGVSEVSNKMKLLNTQQYLAMRRQAFKNDGITPTERNAPDLTIWDQNRYTDWQDVLIGRTAPLTNLSLSLSGGDQHNSYLLGGSHLNQGSVFPGDFNYNKLTVNFNYNHNSKDHKFHLNFSTNYGINTNSIFSGNNFVNDAINTPPNAPPIYNEKGDLNWENWVGGNPLSVLEMPQDIKTHNLLANLSLSYDIFSPLKLKVSMGYSDLENKNRIRHLAESYSPSIREIRPLTALKSSINRNSWIIEPQLIFTKNLKNININALIGGTFQNNTRNILDIEGSGYADNSLTGNLNAADNTRVITDKNVQYRYAAVFGRLGLDWNKKYYLNITGRRDGSSRFGPDRRFSNFWAIAGAWIFSDEKFVKDNLPLLSFGKIRGSYGTTGSDQIEDYGYLDTYEPTTGIGGLYPTQLYNPYYSWEVNKKLEATLQLGFVKDNINLEISWYRNRSSNQLVGYPLPTITGFSSVQANLPAVVQNTGWEIQLNATAVNNNKFTWKSGINLTFPQTKLLEFNNLEQTSYANQFRVGYPLDISFHYQYDGLDNKTGFYRVADINEDGSINSDDQVVIKQMGRKYYGGIYNQFHFKGVSFQFLFEYINQNNRNYIFNSSAPGRFNNKPKQFLNAWEKPSDSERIQKISQSNIASRAFDNAGNSNIGVSDASFLRLKNLSISYNLPPHTFEKLNIQAISLFIRAHNLLTITSYKGLDPQGGRVVPPLRTITCGFQAKL